MSTAPINDHTFVSNFNADDQEVDDIELLTDERGHQYALAQLFTGETLGDALKITPSSSANTTVNIEPGYAQIPMDDYAYQCWLEEPGVSLTLEGASQSLNRISYIVAYVDRRHQYTQTVSNNPGLMYIREVAGDDASNPEPPSASQIETAVGDGNPYILLAQIYVPANATIISLSNVKDLRTKMSLRRGITLPNGTYASGITQASGSASVNPVKLSVINYGAQLPAAEEGTDLLVCELSQ